MGVGLEADDQRIARVQHRALDHGRLGGHQAMALRSSRCALSASGNLRIVVPERFSFSASLGRYLSASAGRSTNFHERTAIKTVIGNANKNISIGDILGKVDASVCWIGNA